MRKDSKQGRIKSVYLHRELRIIKKQKKPKNKKNRLPGVLTAQESTRPLERKIEMESLGNHN